MAPRFAGAPKSTRVGLPGRGALNQPGCGLSAAFLQKLEGGPNCLGTDGQGVQ